MQPGILFWVIYVIAILFGGWSNYEAAPNSGWQRRFGAYLVLWLLLGMLGWQVFGPVIK